MNSKSERLCINSSLKLGKGAGFELGRSGESWVSRRSGRKSGEVELQVGGKWGVYS
nr:hypothetical protein [Tanacetum cinerariifolium]